jgi:hypothetical protein
VEDHHRYERERSQPVDFSSVDARVFHVSHASAALGLRQALVQR